MYCIECGSLLIDSSKFCQNCGKKIEKVFDSKIINENIEVIGNIENSNFVISTIKNNDEKHSNLEIVDKVPKMENITFRDNFDKLKKNKKKLSGYLIFLLVFSILVIVSLINEKIKTLNNSNINTIKSDPTKLCFGNESCIDNIRINFTNSGKQILNESYLNNGIFKITGLDPSKGVTFNSTISTDCNCKLINVRISDIQ